MTHANSSPQPERKPRPEGPPGIPRWVKIFGAVLAAIILVVLILMLLGGNHGPGRHKMGMQATVHHSAPTVALAHAS